MSNSRGGLAKFALILFRSHRLKSEMDLLYSPWLYFRVENSQSKTKWKDKRTDCVYNLFFTVFIFFLPTRRQRDRSIPRYLENIFCFPFCIIPNWMCYTIKNLNRICWGIRLKQICWIEVCTFTKIYCDMYFHDIFKSCLTIFQHYARKG